MGLFNRFRDAKKAEPATQEVSTTSIRVNPLCSNYENLFAQIRPLVDEMKAVRPYGVDTNGAKLQRSATPELNCLDYPNDSMGWVEFIDTCFVIWLTEEELDIHVHRDRGGHVYGYSILPINSRQLRADGTSIFQFNNRMATEYLTEEEVMVLRYSRSPKNIDNGVSPSSTVKYWAQIDDLIAQYQKAFFQNGAVPATVTFIKARSRDSYEKKRDELENKLRGASNKNKTVYVWRQLLDDDSTGDEIEVKTIQGTNNTLALSELIAVVNDKLNKSIGVSNFILGDDSGAKYDNAELSDLQFTKRRVYPALLAFWSTFQHELDRIMGGLGYAIQFDLEIPELTDRLRVKAETAKIQAETLTALIQAGASPSNATSALGMDKSWLGVADGIYSRRLEMDALQAESIANSAIPELPTTTESQHDACCHHEHTVDANYEPSFKLSEKDAKAIYEALIEYAVEIADGEPDISMDDLVAKIDEVIETSANGGFKAGQKFVRTLLVDEGLGTQLQSAFAKGEGISDALKKILAKRVALVVRKYHEDTKDAVEAVLRESAQNAWTQEQLREKLESILPKARAEMIARNETHYAVNAGRYDYDTAVQDRLGIQLGLQWKAHLDSNTCDVCRNMNGTIIPLGESFPDHIMTDAGEIYFHHNEYNDGGRQPDAHVNCRCTFNERVLKK